MKVRSSTFVVAPLASGWPGKLKKSWGRISLRGKERKEGGMECGRIFPDVSV